jgi:hypothetical protein
MSGKLSRFKITADSIFYGLEINNTELEQIERAGVVIDYTEPKHESNQHRITFELGLNGDAISYGVEYLNTTGQWRGGYRTMANDYFIPQKTGWQSIENIILQRVTGLL